MKPQSVLNYIERNRAGLVRSLMQTALEASGYKIAALECPEMAAVRQRLELSVLTAVGFWGLREPPSSFLTSDSNVASEPASSADEIAVGAETSAPPEEPEPQPQTKKRR